MEPTGAQLVAARGLLGLSRPQFAKKAGVSVSTVVRFETGKQISGLAYRPMMAVFADAGVEFIPRGVRMKDEPGSEA